MAAVGRVKLGSQGLEVSKLGLGCMGMSAAYGAPSPEEDMIKLIRRSVDLGVTFLDTADAYGPHTNEILIGKALKGIRDEVQIATKFGVVVNERHELSFKGDPEYVRAAAEASLERLDVDCIDLYYYLRLDAEVPIEVTVRAMKELVDEGKVRYIGLSEVSGSEIRRAHAVHPITAVQLEWSLWARDIEEDVVPTCRELGIGIVPYSPVGKGFFYGVRAADFKDGDARKRFPRSCPENDERNKKFYDRLVEVAKKHGDKSAGQLALSWVCHQGEDVVPIPGTTKEKNLLENVGALDMKLSEAELKEIADAVPENEVEGDRYGEVAMKKTWKEATTPPLSSWRPASKQAS